MQQLINSIVNDEKIQPNYTCENYFDSYFRIPGCPTTFNIYTLISIQVYKDDESDEYDEIIKTTAAFEHWSDQEKYIYGFEYALGGDLFDYYMRYAPLSETESKYIFTQLLNGVKKYCSLGILIKYHWTSNRMFFS
ncbi:hypothetical protein BDF19DRAFT_415386 [Syncephalis fuscata]|nr:hypothetical protein BDF19DRAFT_415386 [Syncephalis fuscata]